MLRPATLSSTNNRHFLAFSTLPVARRSSLKSDVLPTCLSPICFNDNLALTRQVLFRVHRLIVDAYFVVQVWTCGATS